MFKQIPALLRLRGQDTVWRLVCRHLKNPKLRQAFSIQPLLVGGNPFDTTSIYGFIHYLERAHGVHFAMGGTAAITTALGALMARQGIEVKLNTTVRRIDVDEGVASGVTLDDGSSIAADLIVSNADKAHLYAAMIRTEDQASSARLKLATAEFSMGLFVLYFGTTRQYPAVAHHTIRLGERYRELLDDIFSVAPLFRQSAWFRFHNRAEGIRNLYLVGAGTHPGAGLPGVLCSAKVMDALVPSVNTSARDCDPPHVIRSLSLERCSAEKVDVQRWHTRTAAK